MRGKCNESAISGKGNNYDSPVISGRTFGVGGERGGADKEYLRDFVSARDIFVVDSWSGAGGGDVLVKGKGGVAWEHPNYLSNRSNHSNTSGGESFSSAVAIATPQTISEFDKTKKQSRTTVTTTTSTATFFSSNRSADSFRQLATQRHWDFDDNVEKVSEEEDADSQDEDEGFERLWKKDRRDDREEDPAGGWQYGQAPSFLTVGFEGERTMGKGEDPRASPTPGTMTTASGSAASSDISSPTAASELRRKSMTASPHNTTYLLDRDVILGGDDESGMGDTTLGATTVDGGATVGGGGPAPAIPSTVVEEVGESPKGLPSRREYFSLTKHDPEAAIAAATAYKQSDAARGDSPRRQATSAVPPPPLAVGEGQTRSPSGPQKAQSPTSLAASIAAANVAYSASTEEGLDSISPRNRNSQGLATTSPRGIPPPPISGAVDGTGAPSTTETSSPNSASASSRHRLHRHARGPALPSSRGEGIEDGDPSNPAVEPSATERARKSKLEKIRELQTENRGLRAANKALRTQLEEHQWQKQLQRSESGGEASPGRGSPAAGGAGGASTPPAPGTSSAAVVSNAALILKQKDIIRGQREKHLRNKLELLETRKLCRELKAGREEARTLAMRTQKEVDTLNTEVAGLQRELASTLETLEEAQIEKTQSRTKIVQLNKELSVSIDRIRRLEAEQARLQKTGAAAASSSTRRLRAADLADESSELLRKLREELKAKEDELEGVKRELKKKSSQVVTLEVEVDGLREEVDEVKERSAKERRTMEERLIRAESAVKSRKGSPSKKQRDDTDDTASTATDTQNPTPSVASSSTAHNNAVVEQLRQDVLNARSEAAKARDDLESKIRKIVSLEVAVENAQEEVEEIRIKYERDAQQWQRAAAAPVDPRGRQREAFQKRLEALEEENRILREQLKTSSWNASSNNKGTSPRIGSRKASSSHLMSMVPEDGDVPSSQHPHSEDNDAASMGELTAQIECLYQMSLLQGGAVPQSI